MPLYYLALLEKENKILVGSFDKLNDKMKGCINPNFIFEAEENQINEEFVNKKIQEILQTFPEDFEKEGD